MVEFGLVFPLFLVLLFAVIEFAFVLNALLSTGFASHEATLAAAEAGTVGTADCSILKAVQRSFAAPTDRAAITEIRIYKANPDGSPTGLVQIYDKSGTTPCDGPNGTTIDLPWKATTQTYPPAIRCNILTGCATLADPNSKTVDMIGVQITYVYKWHTPMAAALPNGGSGYTMVKSSAMRMEPIL